jgi:hypothetical protein
MMFTQSLKKFCDIVHKLLKFTATIFQLTLEYVIRKIPQECSGTET